MKLNLFIILIILTLSLNAWAVRNNEGCSTVIVDGKASQKGVPMLWKNRDTGHLSNKVIYVPEHPYSYIALVNHDEASGRWAYAGLNSQGFGIMNSVAYNLPKDTSEYQDLEGIIMADALRSCRNVGDFEQSLKKNMGPALGSWANFGVIDAQGHALIFEVHNHGYIIHDAAKPAEKYLVNTNFARSGKEGEGAGYLRFDMAEVLFKQIPGGHISAPYIFRHIARSLSHPLVKHPTFKELESMPSDPPLWINTQDCIDRPYSSAAIVIEGRNPEKKDSMATLWVLLGEPVTSIALPLWVEAGEVPELFYKGEESPLNKEAMRIKKLLYPFSEGSKKNYMNVTRLVNKEGTGFLPLLLKTETEVFKATDKFLKKPRSPFELAAFQKRMAEKAFNALQQIK